MTPSISPGTSGLSTVIALEVPAEAKAARVVRAVASSVASGIPLGYDRIEDLALAIGEAFSFLLSTEPSGLRCTLDPITDGVHVVMDAVEPSVEAPERWETSLNRVVLESIAQDVIESSGQISFLIGISEPTL